MGAPTMSCEHQWMDVTPLNNKPYMGEWACSKCPATKTGMIPSMTEERPMPLMIPPEKAEAVFGPPFELETEVEVTAPGLVDPIAMQVKLRIRPELLLETLHEILGDVSFLEIIKRRIAR